MPRRIGRKLSRERTEALDHIVDGKEFLSAEHIAQQHGVTVDLVWKHVERGHLCPGRAGNYLIFTRADVLRWKAWRQEHDITVRLQAGEHPLDIALTGTYRLEDVTSCMRKWANLTGAWLIEGPRGSYARWLSRLGLVRLSPTHLRRLVELLLTDAYVQQRVQAVVSAKPANSRLDEASAETGLTQVGGGSTTLAGSTPGQ